jgi:hypothetical protein
MVLNLRPKCANPSCAASFDWLGGGRLFRFDRSANLTAPEGTTIDSHRNAHPIGHFWLCERCSNVYTLRQDAERGIIIAPLWPQLPPAEQHMHLPSPG